jgi:hypothetical protein
VIQNAMFATVRSDGDFLSKQEFAGALPCTPSPRLVLLLAVLWFDLMFDVQTRKYSVGPLPPKVLASIWRKTARLCLAFGTFEPGLDLNRAWIFAAICHSLDGSRPLSMAWVFSKPIYLSARGATLPADQIKSRPMSLVQSV